MGDIKKISKKYERPKKLWDKARLEEERKLKKEYGLKNKRELWRIETILRKKRQNARKLLALPLEQRMKRQQELLESLKKFGLVKDKASLDDVLSLKLEELLERRLQTMVLRKGLANTIKQARQFIVHGHIAVNGKKVNKPGYLVSVEEENKISYYGKPMQIKPKTIEKKEIHKKAELKKKFEEVLGKQKPEKETMKPTQGKEKINEKKENKIEKESKKTNKKTGVLA